MQTVDRAVQVGRHPLEPLDAEEIEAASRIAREGRGLDGSTRFVYISLKEPPKQAVLSGAPVPREAELMLWDRARRLTVEATVSLSEGKVTSWQDHPGVQPPVMYEEFLASEAAVKADPRWQEAMRKRGVSDLDHVMIDPWSVGYNGPEDDPSKGRFVRPLTWVRDGSDLENGYARPVEGLIVRVDLDQMKVVDVEDHGVVPLPPKAGNYSPQGIAAEDNYPRFPQGVRTDLKPIEITQPEGRSFTVDGHQIKWQKWQFRIGFNPREGLTLHTISYQDGDRLRPIVYRASLTEMFIPYGDPRPTHRRKNVFDMGESGIGVMTNSLELGCDCLGDIQYFDGFINDNDGHATAIKNAVCLHEEDYGMLWKHTDFRTGAVEVRRSRRLVVSTVATIGNYEYGYFWYLYHDGTIEYEVKLTGVISNGALAPGERPTHGTLVAPQVYGPNHQHFFAVRLDMMVDGERNSVVECDSEAVPAGEDNPWGNAWVVKQKVLQRESDAKRNADASAGRFWKVINPEKKNAVGDPVGYKLEPGPSTISFYQPDAHALQRALFTSHNLWVTPYEPSERFAAGDYPNQSPGGEGLPRWTAADRSVENTDLVLWHCFTAHHVPRPEDWPVMPCTYVGFHLKPFGFFDGNPALDVAPTVAACHGEGQATG
ncbi:MAG: primary-amine oxidase [Candidatus Dormibacteraceae bacterium]